MRNREHFSPVVVEDALNRVLVHPDGTVTRDIDETFHAEAIERMRLGEKCSVCWEELELWINVCPVCEKDRETRDAYFAARFDGTKWIGPELTLEETIAFDDERRERERRNGGTK